MRIPKRALVLAPVCALAMLAATNVLPPTPVPVAPPNGTYTYELLRNGAVQGTTTVALFRRDERSEIETDEAGRFGAATARVVAAFGYADFGTDSYVATYRAPFPHDVALGRLTAGRPHVVFEAPTIVRYDVRKDAVCATLAGVPSSYVSPAPAAPGAKRAPFVLDAPFMTSVVLLPGYRRRTNAADVSWYSLAFPLTADGSAPIAVGAIKRIEAAPHFEKTPKSAIAISVAGLGTIWFDAGNGIVYEAHFDAQNIDAHLTTYARAVEPGSVDPPQALATPAHIASRAIVVPSGDDNLGGVLDYPGTSTTPGPVVVLVPPGPGGNRNYDDDGPQPMFVDLAETLTARGFAVLRYDPRGTGKDAARTSAVTWDDAREDAQAAIAFARSDPRVDRSRVFVLGYGNGADIALASLAAGPRLAGAIALAPTTMRYADCAHKLGADTAHPTPWQRSAFAHDPTKLAERATIPLFVLQPGIGVCGETAADIATYDDALRAADPGATIVVASDLTQFFGGRYDADSAANTQMFFPYRFDTSTLGAIADWLAAPHDASTRRAGTRADDSPSEPRRQPPPPPLQRTTPRESATPSDVTPGQLTIPSFPPAGTPPATAAPTASAVATTPPAPPPGPPR